MPLAKKTDPPSEIIIPPLTNDVEVIFERGVVDNSGGKSVFSFLQLLTETRIIPIIKTEINRIRSLVFMIFTFKIHE
jgi:hypothetical protein